MTHSHGIVKHPKHKDWLLIGCALHGIRTTKPDHTPIRASMVRLFL